MGALHFLWHLVREQGMRKLTIDKLVTIKSINLPFIVLYS